LNIAKVTIVKSSVKIRHYKLCIGVAAYYVITNYAVVWQHAMSSLYWCVCSV